MSYGMIVQKLLMGLLHKDKSQCNSPLLFQHSIPAIITLP